MTMQRTGLRHFIPLSGPATREYVDGTESDFRISVGFTPRWFAERLGIDFSEKWHSDPVYRYETMVRMQRLLHEMFPYLECFRPRPDERGVERGCATISGVYGACPMAAIYGMPIRFAPDAWPDTYTHVPKSELERLTPFQLESNPFVVSLLGQMDKIEEVYGPIDGYLAWQGVLNIAFRLMGQEIFFQLYEDPEFTEFLFDHICNTILHFVELVQERQRRSGFQVNMMSVSNCVVNMVGPRVYENVLAKYDRKLQQSFGSFGIHTCNWDITPLIPGFQSVGELDYLDMGMMSDMRKARTAFPNTRFAVLYHPNEMENKPLSEIRADFLKIREEAAPVDIAMADIDSTVSDDRLQAVFRLAYDLQCGGDGAGCVG